MPLEASRPLALSDQPPPRPRGWQDSEQLVQLLTRALQGHAAAHPLEEGMILKSFLRPTPDPKHHAPSKNLSQALVEEGMAPGPGQSLMLGQPQAPSRARVTRPGPKARLLSIPTRSLCRCLATRPAQRLSV